MDDILDNKGPPIPVNPDPLGSEGIGNNAAEASAGGAVATDSTSAPQARVPIPPVKPRRAVGQGAQGAGD
jgi:hypothetical protein